MLSTIKALEPLLEPQERLDRLIAAAFRRFGPRLVDLSYANPYEGATEEVMHVLRRVTAERKGLSLQYTPYAGRPVTRRAIAAGLEQEYGLPFRFQDIVMTSGGMAGLNVVSRALFRPADEVIVLTPCWQDYPLYLRNLNIPSRLVSLQRDKRLDLSAISRAIGPATRGLLFSHPCCPTGRVYSEEEIVGLSEILEQAQARFGTSIYLVSDEVHRHLVWSGDTFVSPLASYPRSVMIYSFGKALALQGQRIGYVAVSPQMAEREELSVDLERCVRMMGFGSPTSLMQHAVCDLVDYRPSTEALSRKQAQVRGALTSYGYEVCDGGATFYVYVKSPLADDFAFAELLASHGVVVVPSTLFHDPGYVRLSLTARADSIASALPVFGAVLSDVSSACHA
jgi:aspartate aminotransferase